ncbi:substrate-binding domain-containing protein [uncultured Desulfuromusa sp.]|uniref:substrate-binding domain-containing protein n=1 Tax=uncultured Desulfuromusa sp. TaxID=219183 RepID=UPI002AA9007A|nr:substrate-binding domain-containing protein [uncultured Desulfuromusa sp.]
MKKLFLLLFLLAACDLQEYPEAEQTNRSEILIYSGMTMIEPLMEIVALIEAQENCQIKITYGGSGHILKSVEVNQIGDIFFPGDESYINPLRESGVMTESVPVGYNQIGFFVQPGNPKQISADLDHLLDKTLNIVIGSAEAGAVGRETKRILNQAGIYQDVVDNALYMTTDSKGLAAAIKSKTADLTVNWKSVGFLTRNVGGMDFIPLPTEYSQKHPLVMGLLSYSQHPELAKKFLQLASSDAGRGIFRKYGFLD